MAWIGCITDAGAALLARWVNGSTLQVTQCTAGQGTVEAINLRQQTALAEQKQTGNIAAQSELEQGRRFQLEFGANGTAYTLQQIGLWGKLDGGAQTLLAIFQTEDGVSIPAQAENPDFLYTFFASLAMSNEGELQITVDPGAYVSNATFTAYQKQAAEQFLAKSGGTMTGALKLKGDPTEDLEAATKAYVDAKETPAPDLSNYLQKSGGTMTGAITLNGNPTADNMAANKKYVDDGLAQKVSTSQLNNYLRLSGGSMTGALKLKGDPTQDLEAVPKQYIPKVFNKHNISFSIRSQKSLDEFLQTHRFTTGYLSLTVSSDINELTLKGITGGRVSLSFGLYVTKPATINIYNCECVEISGLTNCATNVYCRCSTLIAKDVSINGTYPFRFMDSRAFLSGEITVNSNNQACIACEELSDVRLGTVRFYGGGYSCKVNYGSTLLYPTGSFYDNTTRKTSTILSQIKTYE